jgi:hypothetical protein
MRPLGYWLHGQRLIASLLAISTLTAGVLAIPRFESDATGVFQFCAPDARAESRTEYRAESGATHRLGATRTQRGAWASQASQSRSTSYLRPTRGNEAASHVRWAIRMPAEATGQLLVARNRIAVVSPRGPSSPWSFSAAPRGPPVA